VVAEGILAKRKIVVFNRLSDPLLRAIVRSVHNSTAVKYLFTSFIPTPGINTKCKTHLSARVA
jgi:hypothetical protein